MKFDWHEREKKWARSTSGKRPSCDLFSLWLAPPLLPDRGFAPHRSSITSAFSRSFHSDFTAKETARSLFENKNLFKNLSSQIFQLSTIFRNNVLSLAWKKLDSYKRIFTVNASESKIEKKYQIASILHEDQELSPFGEGGALP